MSTHENSATRADLLDATIPPEAAGKRLDTVLAELFPNYSRSRLQQWLKDGLVTLNGRVLSDKYQKEKLWGGETIIIQVPIPPETQAQQAEALPLTIIYEDPEILVINKPAGLVVHPGHGNWQGTLLNGLLAHCPALASLPRAGIVHRLDKDTSGLLVVAKTFIAQTHLVRQLQERSVSREYWAICYGQVEPSSFTISAPIGRHRLRRTEMSVQPQGKEAITHIQVLEYLTGATLVQCRLATGRTHQIRVHLTHAGYPLVGDPVYKRKASTVVGNLCRQALHAIRLGLIHPTSQQTLGWQVDPPADFLELLEQLRNPSTA